MVKAPVLLRLVPLGRACQEWCFFYKTVKIPSSIILCFPWQPTEHTSDVEGNQRGPWSQQFAEHRALFMNMHYDTWGTPSGTPLTSLEDLYTTEQGLEWRFSKRKLAQLT